jgi:16S rRNA G1207 methylase RsmC
VTDHYFSNDPRSPLEVEPMEAAVWGHELRLDTASGVFARGRLDVGTAVLLDRAPTTGHGDVLSRPRCGYGVIAIALALARPDIDVWAVDINERALELTARNAQRMGVGKRVRAAHPDQVPGGLLFDGIWSNPPIRIGKPELHAMLLRWFARLAVNGEAVMVVGKHLGADSLQRWLGSQGFSTERLASAKSFRVLRSRRSKPEHASVRG